MTHKDIVRATSQGNLVFLDSYRFARRYNSEAIPPAHARQVFPTEKPYSNKSSLKTDRERVRENQKNDHRYKQE